MANAQQTHYRACHLCEAICGLEILTDGDTIVSIKGDKRDPFSQGHICPKATAIQDIQEDPDRLIKPVKRTGDKWQEISWEEAYEIVADKIALLQELNGNNTVGVFAGNPNVHNYGSLTHGSALRRMLNTQNNFSSTSLDQLPHQLVSYAMYGHQFLIPVPDIDHTNYMVIIGGNPLASNGSIMTVPNVKKRLQAIQGRGGKFVVIDPRKTETAKIADEHHFIRPSSDAFLLMAMINCLFEDNLVDTGHVKDLLSGLDTIQEAAAAFTPEIAETQTGIAAETIRKLARDMAEIEGAVCYGRMGVSTQSFGTLCQWAIQVINILSGNFDVRGGTIVPTAAFGNITTADRGRGHYGRTHSRVSGLPEFSGEFPAVVLAEEILTPGEGQIRAMVTLAGNPVLSTPNSRLIEEALTGLDFMVSIDIYINETTRFADIILPPSAPLEHDNYDISFNRLAVRNVTRFNEPVFAPKEGGKHDWQILNELGQKIAEKKGVAAKPLPSPDQIVDFGLQQGVYGAKNGSALALSLDKLKQHPHGLDLGPLEPGFPERLVGEGEGITLDVDFILKDLERLKSSRSSWDQDALVLIGRRHIRSNNSWMHNSPRLVKGPARWHLLMHPDDMAKRNITDQSRVKISSRVGEVVTTVSASDELMNGVVSLPHGWGHNREGVRLQVASAQGGVNCNDLTDDKLIDPISGNAALNSAQVTVTPVAE